MTGISSTVTLLEYHRQQFPALADKAYFNYGGQGPMPKAALEAIIQSYEYVQRFGPFSKKVDSWIVEESNKTRAMIASELSVSPTTITLTEDVTVGCNIAIWGIDWKAGDRLLTTDCEHSGVVATIQEIQRRFNVEVDVCQLIPTLNAGDPVTAITQHLHPNTKLIVLSHILWNTGQVLPIAEIVSACKSICPTVKILVDAAQSVGVLPLNLEQLGVDFYAFTGHKWWCGPEGLGGLYISSEALEDLKPTFIGWRSVQYSKAGMNWHPSGRRFEIATSAFPIFAGLRVAIALHNQWDSHQQRYQQIVNLSRYLWQSLNQLPGVNCLRTSAPEAGLVSFQLSDNSRHLQLVEFLESQGIFIRYIRKPDCVRASIHYLTLPSEIEQLVSKIADFITGV